MIIINKKKIITVLSSVFILMFGIFFLANDKENEYISTVSLPVSGKIVVVDAGHGVPDERSCLLTLKITLIFYKK